MSAYRKLGRTSNQRKAMLRSIVSQVLLHGKVKTTDTRAKEAKKIVEKLIALACKECDNFEEVTIKAKVARKDKDGKRVKEEVNGKKKNLYQKMIYLSQTIQTQKNLLLFQKKFQINFHLIQTSAPQKNTAEKSVLF